MCDFKVGDWVVCVRLEGTCFKKEIERLKEVNEHKMTLSEWQILINELRIENKGLKEKIAGIEKAQNEAKEQLGNAYEINKELKSKIDTLTLSLVDKNSYITKLNDKIKEIEKPAEV